MIKKLTPVLIVDAIEPVLPFWSALGFTTATSVPHGDAIGFVILVRDGVEVMYQSRASVAEDNAAALEGSGRTALFFEVSDLEEIMRALSGPFLADRRKTFYGSTETILRDPAGNVITFAQFQ
ncbi:MAG TPA: VOC family protein [Thermoanaerobaculia bacterium]|nr:VOC family protein [Thermoanaerobaculia bacterium]